MSLREGLYRRMFNCKNLGNSRAVYCTSLARGAKKGYATSLARGAKKEYATLRDATTDYILLN